jgi:hypothetical protein
MVRVYKKQERVQSAVYSANYRGYLYPWLEHRACHGIVKDAGLPLTLPAMKDILDK